MKAILISVSFLFLCSGLFAMVQVLTEGDYLITYGYNVYKAPASGSISILSVSQSTLSTSQIVFRSSNGLSKVTVTTSTLQSDISNAQAVLTKLNNYSQTVSALSAEYAQAQQQINTLSNIMKAENDMLHSVINNLIN